MPDAARIVALISGRGRNLHAIERGCAQGRIAGRIVSVISNRADAPGLGYAADVGLATQVLPHVDYPSREAFDAALADALDALRPDMILLAGFMRVLTAGFVRRYAGHLLNIHPSLLPRHPGLHTHRRALEAGDVEHGATVHFVTEDLDGGPRIIQGGVRVYRDDSPEILSDRVMREVELKIYPQAVAWMARGELRCEQGLAVLRGRRLDRPLDLADLEEAFQ